MSNEIQVINPATGNVVATYPAYTARQVDQAIETAAKAQRAWAQVDVEERAAGLRRLANSLRDRKGELAGLMATEMGKPITDGHGEVEKCAWVCEHYADHGAELIASEPLPSDAKRAYLAYRPLGVILAVMPWNFPLWQVFRFLAPTWMAGNAAVLKHASNVPGSALAIEDLVRSANAAGEYSEDLFRTLLIGAEEVPRILAMDAVKAATLTGSTRAGRSVAEAAGKNLKKVVIELGGSDPYVILDDADLDAAAEACATSRLINSGQSCIAAKRFIAVDAVHDEFVERLKHAMAKQRLGDPMDEATQIGPQARKGLRDELHSQVQKSIDAGARLVLGGEVPDGPGAYYPATLLVDVVPGMPVYDEEVFGPAGAVIRAKNEDEAIERANDTVFGLGAAVFTRDLERGQAVAEYELEAGCCFVNDFVRSDPRLPFGGIKQSGYGRELSALGIREFMNQKTVYVAS